MRELILAIQFLTRLPTPQLAALREGEMASSARWFPLVGLLIGALLAGVFVLGQQTHAALAALLTLVLWVWVTGGLHLDGLADLADALGASHRDPKRFFEVLRDPHLGSFGVMALVLTLLAKLVLLTLLTPAAWMALLLIPAWARLGPLAWTRGLPALHSGMGERFAWHISALVPVLWTLLLLAVSAMQAAPLLAFPLLIALWGLWLHRHLGGQCGDALGAGIEITETAALALLVLLQNPPILALQS